MCMFHSRCVFGRFEHDENQSLPDTGTQAVTFIDTWLFSAVDVYSHVALIRLMCLLDCAVCACASGSCKWSSSHLMDKPQCDGATASLIRLMCLFPLSCPCLRAWFMQVEQLLQMDKPQCDDGAHGVKCDRHVHALNPNALKS
jgi:hypothetical protein